MRNTKIFLDFLNNKETYNKILDLSIECYADSFESMNRWYSDVILYADGTIIKAYRSYNTMLQSKYNDEFITVASFESQEKPSLSDSIHDNIEGPEKIEEFKKWLISEYELEKDYDFDEDKNDLFNTSKFAEFDPELIKELEDEELEYDIDHYWRDVTQEKIERTIRKLENELHYENY